MEKKLTYEEIFNLAIAGNEYCQKILIDMWKILAEDYYLGNFKNIRKYRKNQRLFDNFINEYIPLLETNNQPILLEDVNKYIETEIKEIPLERKRK